MRRRVFEVDAAVYPDCGGQMHMVAAITERNVIERILEHVGLPTESPADGLLGAHRSIS